MRTGRNFDFHNHAPLNDMRAIVEAELGQRGRILIRASGTEPLLRIMVEAETEALARGAAEQLAATVPVQA